MIANLIQNGQVTAWREVYNDLLEDLAKEYPEANVLDIGKSAQWHYDGLWKSYKVMDIQPLSNPDILDDFMKHDFGNEKFNIILCYGVYEWVSDIRAMVAKITQILTIGGIAIFGFIGRDYEGEKPNGSYYKGENLFNNLHVIGNYYWEEKMYMFVCQKPILALNNIVKVG